MDSHHCEFILVCMGINCCQPFFFCGYERYCSRQMKFNLISDLQYRSVFVTLNCCIAASRGDQRLGSGSPNVTVPFP